MASQPAAVQSITDPASAQLLVHPLRAEILAHAHEPASAAEIAKQIGQTRQKVGYHLKKLVDAGLLEPAGEQKVRGATERFYQATARAYLLAPEVLGPLMPDPASAGEALSASYLLALTARAQNELAHVIEEAQAEGSRVATLSMDAEVHFTGPEQRKAFTEALQEAITRVIETHSVSANAPGARSFRLLTGAYPTPGERA